MRYLRLLESRRKIEVCWHAITDKKKKNKKHASERSYQWSVERSFPVRSYRYLTRRSITMIIVLLIIKKVPHDLGVNLIIIGSTSHACPYLFNLDLVWTSWSYQCLFILPYHANLMWSSIGWDSLSQRKLIQNRSVSNAQSIWRYELKFRIKHLVNLQIPVSPEQVHRGEPTWSTPNNISKVSPRETAERRHIASRATRYNIWPWLASLFSTAVCSKLLPLLIFPAFEIAFSCSWLSMVVSVSFLVRKSLSSASAV